MAPEATSPGGGDLPPGLVHVRTTDVFDEHTAPAGLRRAHRVADGVWARLVVHTGALSFVFEDDAGRPLPLTAGGAVVIPPARPHHVVVDQGPVTFAIEFHRLPTGTGPTPGSESTGLSPA